MTGNVFYKFITPAAIKVLEDLPENEMFNTKDFQKSVAALCPRAANALPSSIIRPIWTYRQRNDKKCAFICIDKNNGIYQKISLESWNNKYSFCISEDKETARITKAKRLLKKYGYSIRKRG